MITEIVKNSARFIILLFLQVLIVKNIYLGKYFIFFPYILFILLLPFQTPRPFALLVSFALGLAVDAFYNTQGMHAASCVLMAFARGGVLKLFSPREGYDEILKPTIEHMGFTWFVSYSLVLIFIHHLLLFFLESFSFSEFLQTAARVFCSTLATFAFVIPLQFLFHRREERI